MQFPGLGVYLLLSYVTVLLWFKIPSFGWMQGGSHSTQLQLGALLMFVLYVYIFTLINILFVTVHEAQS